MLGALGLLPLVAAAVVYAAGPEALAGPALLTLLAYSAAVVSYLGGVRWGVEITRPRPRWSVLALSNVAPVAAWLLVAASGAAGLTEGQALGGFLAAFVLHGLWDALAKDPPRWYARLRAVLTVGVVLALGGALTATLAG